MNTCTKQVFQGTYGETFVIVPSENSDYLGSELNNEIKFTVAE